MLFLSAVITAFTSDNSQYNSETVYHLNQLKRDLMEFTKELHDNSTGDLEARIEILENDVEGLELNFDIIQEEVIEIKCDLNGLYKYNALTVNSCCDLIVEGYGDPGQFGISSTF